jgi:D-threo-aldose 1-dehydrogenase
MIVQQQVSLPEDWLVPKALGRSNVRVGRIGLGLREIGADPVRTRAMLSRAVDLGITYFDTAPSYGLGISETRFGDALPELGRDNLVISTKVGVDLRRSTRSGKVLHVVSETIFGGPEGRRLFADRVNRVARPHPSPPKDPNAPPSATRGLDVSALCDYTYDGVMRSLETSLARLRTDRVDILFIHDPVVHYRQAIRGPYRALQQLRREGTVGAIGVGMNQTRLLRRFADDGEFDVFLLAGRYSLMDQSASTDLFPLAVERGISIVLAGVFNGGLLATPVATAEFDYGPTPPDKLAHALRLKAVCDRHGVSLKAAALAFSFGHPAVHNLLLGATSAAELDENIALLQAPIPPELWSDLRSEGLLLEGVPQPA